MRRRFIATELGPWKLQFLMLGLVFLIELCVMLLLMPALRIEGEGLWRAAVLDALILTLVLVPLFGWLVVRPMSHMLKARARLLEQFIAIQEEERARIARDLYDEIGQSFTMVLLGLRAMNEPSVPPDLRRRALELSEVVGKTLEEVRRLARGLRPAVLDHLGLPQAIEQYAEDFAAAHGLSVEVTAAPFDMTRRLPSAIETAAYRIAQESLTNAARHASARRVAVKLSLTKDWLELAVVDDGHGFPADHPADIAGAGILGMTERAALVRGTVDVVSSGAGTAVRARIPVPTRRGDP